MIDSKKNEKFWQEWDAFCRPLIEGTRAVDSGKSLQDFQNDGLPSPEELSIFLDAFLRTAIDPSFDGILAEQFPETPPMLEKALRERIADAEVFLTRILEREEAQNIQGEADLKKMHLSFQKFLLPSSPKPGEYYFLPPDR